MTNHTLRTIISTYTVSTATAERHEAVFSGDTADVSIETVLSKVAAQNLPITQLYEQEPNARLGNPSAD
jgi:hypothetical protein